MEIDMSRLYDLTLAVKGSKVKESIPYISNSLFRCGFDKFADTGHGSIVCFRRQHDGRGGVERVASFADKSFSSSSRSYSKYPCHLSCVTTSFDTFKKVLDYLIGELGFTPTNIVEEKAVGDGKKKEKKGKKRKK